MGGKSVIKMLVVIVERGKGDDVTDYLRDKNILFNFTLLGHGTASSQWVGIFGGGESKKEVFFAIVPSERITEVLEGLGEEFNLREPGHGVAFTVDINSIGGKRLLNYVLGNAEV
jgi:hypothetical protein